MKILEKIGQGCLLVFLAGAFFTVLLMLLAFLFSDLLTGFLDFSKHVADLWEWGQKKDLNSNDQNHVISRNLALMVGAGIGTILLTFRTISAHLSAKAAVNQVGLARKGNLTDRFSKAMELLGHQESTIRFGGIIALGQIAAEDRPTYHWSVIEVLTGHLRSRAPTPKKDDNGHAKKDAQGGYELEKGGSIDWIEEYQVVKAAVGILKELLQKEHINHVKGEINLAFTNLKGTNLEGAIIQKALLNGVDFAGSGLQGVNLSKAIMCGANLFKTDLRESNLDGAELRATNLNESKVEGANFTDVDLRGSNLLKIDFSTTVLDGADLRNFGEKQTIKPGTTVHPLVTNVTASQLKSAKSIVGIKLQQGNFPDQENESLIQSGAIFVQAEGSTPPT